MAEQPRRQGLPTLDELNQIVLEFLNKKGYARTEAMLRLESARASSGTGQYAQPVLSGPAAYSAAYLALKEWVESSLDLYQPELSRVLYPVFVHIYLELHADNHPQDAQAFFEEFNEDQRVLHMDEIEKLGGIKLAIHVDENELAQRFRNTKQKVQMSRTSFDLLLYFLHSVEAAGGSIVIRIINQYIDLSVYGDRPDTSEALAAQAAGGSIDSFNSQPVKLGKPVLDQEFATDVKGLLDQHDKENKTELASVFEESSKPDTDSPAQDAVPWPKYRPVDVDAAVQRVINYSNQIKLDPQANVPSVCIYTVHNTRDELNVLDINNECSLAAGGFQDSYIQLWNLKGERLAGVLKDDRSAGSSRRLIGHSGAVYGLSFAPDNRTLLSSSQDSTVRLWSLDTYTSLVSYKGHTEPVWDVSYGPFGHYFATASHDQTARLWSSDHIYPLRIFAGHMSDVDCVVFHPNGSYVFTGSSDKTVRMWDITKGTCLRVFIGHIAAITALAVSPDGRWLVTAGEDAIINVWDIGSGRRLKYMRGHGQAGIYSLAFSNEGSVLVSCGADNSVRVWDIKKGTADTGPQPEPFEGLSTNGQAKKRKDVVSTEDHMAVFYTKRTPVYKVQFTPRNLVVAGGAFLG